MDLGLALADVLEELRRTQDRVDERADKGEERSGSGAADQERIGDAAAGVGEGVDDRGEIDRDHAEDREGDDEIDGGVVDSEDGEWHGVLEEHPSE